MTLNISQALTKIPAELRSYLTPVISHHEFSGQLSPRQVNQLASLAKTDASAIPLKLLPLAAAYALTPISDFQVGAIARGFSGTLYFGANMEFAKTQMGQTIHAEQAAISHAWMSGETALTDIIIDTPPCGHCRQFMNELTSADTLQIQLPDKPACGLHHYLPEAFGPGDLGITSGLMSEKNHMKHINTQDELVLCALHALNQSHAPYSQNYSGVAVQMRDQKIYMGAYAENAAFNPSLPPLQVALVQARMGGHELNEIQRVVLTEMSHATVSHLIDTQYVLRQIGPLLECEYHQIDE
ncbi:Cytidine deaminase [Vibrio aerogenes CECT 7868]|uniref:Cytidine deaminase n=1 Tax=Vibrio aerogenes CECT 7868 TaxID=1216006 RepID=A0A1M5XV50_9VIBR|nr:cytidine deaminase [Vibrio aerogenes]SHI03592.1 Cytidine deaminase [Vibrio aerogenes CECT 7868]